MRIIEFYGLPGSGKSVVSHRLIEELRSDGFCVMDYQSYTKSNGKKNVIRGILRVQGFKYFIYAVVFLIKNGLLFSIDVVKRMLFCLTFIAFYYDKRVRTSDYVIMDEGIIQGVVSAIFDYESDSLSFKWLAEIIEKISIQTVYVAMSPEHSNERIEMRGAIAHGRCDAMSSEERIAVLRVQANNFNKVFNAIVGCKASIKVDGKESIESKVDHIKRNI